MSTQVWHLESDDLSSARRQQQVLDRLATATGGVSVRGIRFGRTSTGRITAIGSILAIR